MNQDERRALLTQAFVQRFGQPPSIWVRAPGRVDLMGSHTDYNLGYVLTLPIDRDTWMAARPRADRIACVQSLNAPGSNQFADQVLPEVEKLGNIGTGVPFFDPLAFRPVTAVRFGTAGFNQLRGPGNTNIDLGVFRAIRITERWNVQIRAEALNATNTPHFSNPGTGVNNMQLNTNGTIKSLGGFSQITVANPLGRIIDQRYFRFALRINF